VSACWNSRENKNPSHTSPKRMTYSKMTHMQSRKE
jgi:hypothetical protein